MDPELTRDVDLHCSTGTVHFTPRHELMLAVNLLLQSPTAHSYLYTF